MGFFKNIFYIGKKIIEISVVAIKNELAPFFEKALTMMRTVLNKIAGRVRGVILGSAHFFRRVGTKYQEGVKNYSIEEELGEWSETTVTREIMLEDIPPQYRGLEQEFEIDDTRELNSALTY